ncbi:5'-3' exoribonuclease 1-like [Teleopsis dalmanni]|uniref:5'-3' exoribonuclease 1-like n=1 Tax=Teleopsis dalmanni TaxID=139649 RepID=UPI0018CEA8CD|nr:5'-3' exoribonuclease 1-like [Teleopsis dalmanni]
MCAKLQLCAKLIYLTPYQHNLQYFLEDILETIISANGLQLTAEALKYFCLKLGIKHITTAPFHAASNGLAERFVRSFKTAVKKNIDDGLSLKFAVSKYLATYRAMPNAEGKSPAELLHGKVESTFLDDSDCSLDEPQHIAEEFEMHKRNYYMEKLNQNNITSQQKREYAYRYITALQWNLDYYYRGVQSWDWYYPHHYAPFISDLKDFKDFKIEFNIGEPFFPYEQLLAVLPAASKQLLPLAYQDLMTNSNSEIIHFYPKTFDTDLNGKKHEWESIVLIPFIDEKLLINAMKPCSVNLTPQEIERNKFGPMLKYDYTSSAQGKISGIYTMEAIQKVFCFEKEVWSHEIAISSSDTVCTKSSNASNNVFFPGFPTMKHLNYKFEFKPQRVKVFDQPSRGDNLILKPQKRNEFDDVYKVAEKFLGQTVYIGWPHLMKSTVATVFNNDVIISKTGIKENDPKQFQLNVKSTQEHLLMRMGIELEDYDVMMQVHAYVGKAYICGAMGKIVQNDVWSPLTTNYPVQCVVPEISLIQNKNIGVQKIEEFFPVGTLTFYLGNKYHACAGEVIDPMTAYINGRICLRILSYKYPDFTEAIELHNGLKENYVNSYNASSIIGISPKCLGRITGTVLVVAGVRRNKNLENVPKLNIGLQLKFPKQQEERIGYARCLRNQWHYSSKAIELVKNYFIQYPQVFEYLNLLSDKNGLIFESDIFPDNLGEHYIEKIVTWIKSQDHNTSDRIVCGSEVAEKGSVEMVIRIINDIKNHPFKEIKAYVKPHLLIKPDVTLPLMYKSPKPIKLFDRVVIVKTTYMVNIIL